MLRRGRWVQKRKEGQSKNLEDKEIIRIKPPSPRESVAQDKSKTIQIFHPIKHKTRNNSVGGFPYKDPSLT